MKVWIKYSVYGWADSKAYNDDVEFRTQLLGEAHWSAISMSGPERTICLLVEEDIAILFALKYPNCQLDKLVSITA